MGQIILFHTLAVQSYMRDRAAKITDLAVAMHAKQQDRNNFISKLEKATKRKR